MRNFTNYFIIIFLLQQKWLVEFELGYLIDSKIRDWWLIEKNLAYSIMFYWTCVIDFIGWILCNWKLSIKNQISNTNFGPNYRIINFDRSTNRGARTLIWINQWSSMIDSIKFPNLNINRTHLNEKLMSWKLKYEFHICKEIIKKKTDIILMWDQLIINY